LAKETAHIPESVEKDTTASAKNSIKADRKIAVAKKSFLHLGL